MPPPAPWTLPIVDLSGREATASRAEAAQLATAAAQEPFDLARGPLFRARLVRLAPHDHLLLLTWHHSVTDGWSLVVFWEELTTLYAAFAAGGTSSPLPPLPIQFADFVAWQRQRLADDMRRERQLDYWKTRLAGVPTILDLPTDFPRAGSATFQGATSIWKMPPPLTEAVLALGRQAGTTPFMTLLAAFATLLFRYTGQDEILIGSPTANRQRREFEPLIGFFVNTLVFHADLTGNPSFLVLLARIREMALGAYAHQDIPFEQLVEVLHPVRDINRTPLFQVMLSYQGAPLAPHQAGGLTFTPLEAAPGEAKFDLLLDLWEAPEGLTLHFGYNADLFESGTIARMVAHFQTLLESVVADPTQTIAALPLLTPAERHQMLVTWNATQVDYPLNRCLHHLVEAQVARTPDAIAVVYEGQTLTYRELDQRANQLAHHLRRRGVGPDVLVAICVERSFEMIVGLLGILKAGGAYVPLDPTYPSERLAYMLADTGTPVILTQTHLVECLPPHSAEVLCLDSHPLTWAGEPTTAPQSGVTVNHLAYVIYTSGSTGQPKGVMIPHFGISHHLQWRQLRFPLTSADRFLQKATFSFDISVWELFGPLIGGARLILARPGGQQESDYLTALIAEEGITIAVFIPSMLQVMLEQPGFVGAATLKRLFCGGEGLPPDLQDRCFALMPGVQLYHLYGPTEASIDVTHWVCQPGNRVVPIGHPVGNTQIYLLDQHLQPVPIGVHGEVYVGGLGLARGYLHQPALTATKFIPDPFSRASGARLYRTGDLGRALPDGAVQFLGRIGTQVKVRGFRIELGEIEAALEQHPAVQSAVVVVREEAAGQKFLVAYVVCHPQAEAVTPSDLRNTLKQTLPEYMVPAAFVFLEALPRTPNGKLDRRALPAPDYESRPLERAFAAPRSPTEELLATLWAEILRLERVSVQANFFELGGHSLLATQVLSRVRAAFQVEIPLRALFEAPTVAELAERIETARKSAHGTLLPPLRPRGRTEPLPLSFAQQRLWFLDQLSPDSAFYNIPLVLTLTGRLDRAALEASLNAIVQRHEALRTTFAVRDGDPVQVIAPALTIPLPITDLSALPAPARAAEAERLVQAEARRPFDLAHGPLLRAALVQLAADEHQLSLTFHHIVSDAWSGEIFFRELAHYYHAFTADQPPSLPPLPVQYPDFALWQHGWLQGETLAQQMAYWQHHLKGSTYVLSLPTDFPRPPAQSFQGATHALLLPAALRDQLAVLSQREGATLFMTLLGAFAVLLMRYTQQDDLIIGIPIANRTQTESEGLIGFFVNTLPLRFDLSGHPTFREFLRRVRQLTLDAYAHQDVPFEKMVELLAPERDLSRTPIVQVMFAWETAGGGEPLTLSGLTLEAAAIDTGTAKFDFGLNVAETPEGLACVFEYSTDLFEATTITRWAGHFQTLLEGIASAPAQHLATLPLLPEAEQTQLLFSWNETTTPYPRAACIHDLFTAQAQRTPDALALRFGTAHATYAELERQANQLAHTLRGLGVGPESIVAVFMERSFDMIVALLGILKAGGAYLPLDPTHPPARVAFMLADTQATVVLTHTTLLPALPRTPQRQVVCLDRDHDRIRRQPHTPPPSGVVADSPAYVMYTSGSTGHPKGIIIPHRGVVRLVVETDYISFAPTDRVSQTSNASFDTATFEIWGALLHGAALVGIPTDVILVPGLLAEFLQQHQITILFLTTALFHQTARDLPGAFQGIPTVITGGEALDPHLARRVCRHPAAPPRLLNGYGPTESTTFASCEWVRTVPDAATTVPIGRPIANTTLYILDRAFEPTPIGVPGELLIGGDGLAQGYFKRPDLTAERFIPHPFSPTPGARLYRTGDLARYRPDGVIEFLGRADDQVKIRGFRIELGEIEATLAQHPAVAEAVVLARPAADGSRQLVAYVVSPPMQTASVGDLRAFLKTQLPDYMVPGAFVFLAALPLTPNGKIDRRALPAPDFSGHAAGSDAVAPRTPTEAALADIWAEVLHLPQVGVHANFFEVGGHSLLATQMVARIRRTFDVEVPLRDLFSAPTIAELATTVEALILAEISALDEAEAARQLALS